MAYVVKNANVFTAAFSGALAGMGVSGRVNVSADPARYTGLIAVANAFAEELDTLWGVTPVASLEVETIQESSESLWQFRSPSVSAVTLTPSTWQSECQAIITIVQQALAWYASQGYPNPPIGGGGGAVAPFSQWKYIDPLSAAATEDGSVSAPYKSVLNMIAGGGAYGEIVGQYPIAPQAIPDGAFFALRAGPSSIAAQPRFVLGNGCFYFADNVDIVQLTASNPANTGAVLARGIQQPIAGTTLVNVTGGIALPAYTIELANYSIASPISAATLSLDSCSLSQLGPNVSSLTTNGLFAVNCSFLAATTHILGVGGGSYKNCTFQALITIDNSASIAEFDAVSWETFFSTGGTLVNPANIKVIGGLPATCKWFSTLDLGPTGLHFPGDASLVAFPAVVHQSVTGKVLVKVKVQFAAQGIGAGSGQLVAQSGVTALVGALAYNGFNALPSPNEICCMLTLIGYDTPGPGPYTLSSVFANHYAPGGGVGEELIAQDYYVEIQDVGVIMTPP